MASNKLRDKFFSTDKTIQCRLMNACLLTGIICTIIEVFINIFLKIHIYSLITVIASFVVCVITLLIANVWNKPLFASSFLVLTINLLIFPFMYLVSGGYTSGAPIWLLMGLLLSFAITTGRKRTILTFIISAIGPIYAVILGYLHPEYVIPLKTQTQITFDIIIAVILASLFFGVMYKIQASVYEHQKKQIEDSANVAIEATKAKTTFISNMTHDIRTPMNSIVGFTEIARKNVDNRTTLLESLSCLSLASEHLLSLVNDVLDIAKIESGKLVLKNEPVTITSIVENVEKIMTPEIEDLNLHLIVDLSDVYDESMNCDVLRFTQVLINIMSNAVKFSNPGGRIYLTVNQKQSPAGDTILSEIRIRDEGIGINPDYLPHIFEPFTRESRISVSGTSGSGLGLSISKQIIEMMHGTITVNSEVGKGTEFVIKIPFEMPTLAEIETQALEKIDYGFAGKKVLVVEDNDLNLRIVSELLSDEGFIVDSVSDGTYAIEKIQSTKPGFYDVVLMDIQMPLMSGYEATDIIRSMEDEKTANVPIIALTANAFEEDREKAEKCGMNDFIAKPINAHEMFATLQKVLDL